MMTPELPFAMCATPLWAGSSQDPSDGAAPRGAPSSEAVGILRGKRVVIVEDEAITQIQLRKICVSAGMQVVGLAADGEQGVRKVLELRPDMVLLDINLPLLDGLSAAERMLKEVSACVVMLTAYDGEEYRQRARALGTCAYIIKPVTSSSLLPKLEAAFRRFQYGPS
jgi:AmiR/NasT family two-component response regulator